MFQCIEGVGGHRRKVNTAQIAVGTAAHEFVPTASRQRLTCALDRRDRPSLWILCLVQDEGLNEVYCEY